MNRKERRAAHKGRQGGTLPVGATSGFDAARMFAAAVKHYQAGESAPAQELCRSIVARDPRHTDSLALLGTIAKEAGRVTAAIKFLGQAIELSEPKAIYHDSLAQAYQAAGRLDEAVHQFSMALAVGLADVEMLLCQSPAVSGCIQRLNAAWPRRPTLRELLGADGLEAMANEALLLAALQSKAICDLDLERLFTALRFALLQVAVAADPPAFSERALGLLGALAQQCFLTEYVYTLSEPERALFEPLRDRVAGALNASEAMPPLALIAVACYAPLHALPVPRPLAGRSLPAVLRALIRQQVEEPQAEAEDRKSIPALTPIEHAVSLQVQQQYEENPYPRWTMIGPPWPTTLAHYLQDKLPAAPVRPLELRQRFDLLVAGCGTGSHSIGTAQRFPEAQVLAIDISRSSLAYARRKSREAGLRNIEYAQADILKLPEAGRSFDVIESVGVLHHLADPAAGWRSLVSLLRPNGLMLIALYSELGRRSLAPARDLIAERGYRPVPADIRAFRQDLIQRRQVPAFADFFCVSGCRDLFFNVMEHRFTIPQIKQLIAESGLTFLGFELAPAVNQHFQQQFPGRGALSDLDCWHQFELANPRTFASMYSFWLQK